MKNVLIFASLAAIASAVAIYFVSESNKSSNFVDDEYDYETEYDLDTFGRGAKVDMADSI